MQEFKIIQLKDESEQKFHVRYTVLLLKEPVLLQMAILQFENSIHIFQVSKNHKAFNLHH